MFSCIALQTDIRQATFIELLMEEQMKEHIVRLGWQKLNLCKLNGNTVIWQYILYSRDDYCMPSSLDNIISAGDYVLIY
jgi:hypothetical protein